MFGFHLGHLGFLLSIVQWATGNVENSTAKMSYLNNRVDCIDCETFNSTGRCRSITCHPEDLSVSCYGCPVSIGSLENRCWKCLDNKDCEDGLYHRVECSNGESPGSCIGQGCSILSGISTCWRCPVEANFLCFLRDCQANDEPNTCYGYCNYGIPHYIVQNSSDAVDNLSENRTLFSGNITLIVTDNLYPMANDTNSSLVEQPSTNVSSEPAPLPPMPDPPTDPGQGPSQAPLPPYAPQPNNNANQGVPEPSPGALPNQAPVNSQGSPTNGLRTAKNEEASGSLAKEVILYRKYHKTARESVPGLPPKKGSRGLKNHISSHGRQATPNVSPDNNNAPPLDNQGGPPPPGPNMYAESPQQSPQSGSPAPLRNNGQPPPANPQQGLPPSASVQNGGAAPPPPATAPPAGLPPQGPPPQNGDVSPQTPQDGPPAPDPIPYASPPPPVNNIHNGGQPAGKQSQDSIDPQGYHPPQNNEMPNVEVATNDQLYARAPGEDEAEDMERPSARLRIQRMSMKDGEIGRLRSQNGNESAGVNGSNWNGECIKCMTVDNGHRVCKVIDCNMEKQGMDEDSPSCGDCELLSDIDMVLYCKPCTNETRMNSMRYSVHAQMAPEKQETAKANKCFRCRPGGQDCQEIQCDRRSRECFKDRMKVPCGLDCLSCQNGVLEGCLFIPCRIGDGPGTCYGNC